MSSLYFVQYGFNFSHMTEVISFKLYRDAVKFFESLNKEMYPSSVCYKQSFSKAPGDQIGEIAQNREVKLFNLEPGKDCTVALIAITEGNF